MTAKFLVRYGEIALKGRNRGEFEQQLHRNLKGAVEDYSAEVERMHGRFMVSGPEANRAGMLENLSRVFGVVSLSSTWEAKLDFEIIKIRAAEIFGQPSAANTSFKVASRRANKKFPYTSPEINQLLGGHLLEKQPGLKVDLHNPDIILNVEIGYKSAYLYLDKIAGPGGLPVGITGKSLLLLSGGIDSPVAGWLAMKRGLSLEAVHFHSFPYTSRHSSDKALELCKKLARYGGKIPLHMINVAEIQKTLRLECPPEMGIILLRRMMYRLAQLVCEKRHLQALVTGENLGQVASQTLESIEVISKATDMLVLRPLVSFDKIEIVSIARDIDSFDISVLPYEDCCTIFLPKSPVTKPKLEVVENFEKRLDISTMLDQALQTAELHVVKRSSTYSSSA